MGYGLKVTFFEVLGCPVECAFKFAVFLFKGGVRQGSAIGIDAERNFFFEEEVGGVVFHFPKNTYLNIAGGAYLQVYPFL